MSDFEYDVLERKRLARQARYRKCGNKSKKCSLPSDNMTQKQWRERNGEVVSFNMNAPVSWGTFKSVSQEIQKEYIESLIQRFGANATSLSEMFGVTPSAIRKHVGTGGLGVKFQVGHSMNAAQRETWSRFLAPESGDDQEKSDGASEQTPPCADADISRERPHVPSEHKNSMAMDGFRLVFSGPINVHTIANSLLQILGNDSMGTVEINCNLTACS